MSIARRTSANALDKSRRKSVCLKKSQHPSDLQDNVSGSRSCGPRTMMSDSVSSSFRSRTYEVLVYSSVQCSGGELLLARARRERGREREGGSS